MMKLLLDHRASVDVPDSDGRTALSFCASYGELARMQRLIEAGADVNAEPWPPLYQAASGGHSDCVKLLLKKRAYVNLGAAPGQSPLAVACQQGHAGCVKLLLNAKAWTGEVNGISPLGCAVGGAHGACVEALADHDQQQGALEEMYRRDEEDKAERLRAQLAAAAVAEGREEREDDATLAEREAEKERHELAVRERARRAETQVERPFTSAGPSHIESKGKAYRPVSTQAILEHEEHISEAAKQRRSEAFDVKQRQEHEDKLVRQQAEAEAQARREQAEASARAEARAHVVPPPPKLSEQVSDSLLHRLLH